MIKLHKPFLDADEIKAVVEVLHSKDIGSGGSVETLLQKDLKNYFKIKHSISLPGGTAALELSVASLGIKEGDEVIVPSFTFPSDVNAILLQGATIKFADIDPVYFNIDPESIRQQISPKTKAILVVHYAGMSCQMDAIKTIAKEYRLKIIEDSSHAWGSSYKGKLLGTIGDVGCFSLHATKNITCGEGGVFITNSDEIYENAEIYRQVGTNRYHFMEGKINKYEWIAKGSSYYMSGLHAAVVRTQLKKLNKINKSRKQVAELYLELLDGIKEITLPKVPIDCDPNWHIFAVLINNSKRDALIKYLKSKGIETAFHFVPLHLSKMGRKMGHKKSDFKVTHSVASSLLRLPIYPDLTQSNVKYISSSIKKFLKK